MRKLLDSRQFESTSGFYKADLFFESGTAQARYVLELRDPTGALARTLGLSATTAYYLKTSHQISPEGVLFSEAQAFVKEVYESIAFQSWLQSLEV